MCPASARLVNGAGGLLAPATMCCHVLLIETERDGLVLVDTGLGTDDVREPRARLGGGFLAATRPKLDVEQTALRQVERLGFARADVRHVVPTHLDLDHAGGLPDFPDATVHVYGPERRAATERATFHERMRYRPAHFAHGPKWKEYALEGDTWLGFERVRALGDDVFLVPLVGHSRGHVAVGVRRGDGWMLHAGDAYFFHGEVDGEAPCPPALRFFQWYVAFDDGARVANQRRLRELAAQEAERVRVFSAHCPVELARMRA